jgi:hypothetical protein
MSATSAAATSGAAAVAEVAAMVVETLALAFPLALGSASAAFIALILGVVVIEVVGVDVVVGVMLSL